MDEIITKLKDLPTKFYGLTIRDKEGDFNIFINSRMSRERQIEAYEHELEHIRRGDFSRSGSVDIIEIHAHQSGGNEK